MTPRLRPVISICYGQSTNPEPCTRQPIGSAGRYPNLQRRVVELEAAIGPLTQRIRGGEDGGGTQLTADAIALIRKFERLHTELTGVATVPESIIRGTVRSRDGGQVTVQTPAGDILARRASIHDGEVEIAVRADAGVLLNPGSPSEVHTIL